jgi:hypothetical protein
MGKKVVALDPTRRAWLAAVLAGAVVLLRPRKLRAVERQEAGGWRRVRMRQLRPGDRFRIHHSGGGFWEGVALGEPLLSGGDWVVEMDIQVIQSVPA